MRDEDKTREQLLREMRELRKLIAESKKLKGAKNDASDLRRFAEQQLRARPIQTDLPQTKEEVGGLLHELQVHQIELEMQNDELRRTQEQLESSLTHYRELYDFAPVGYVTVSEEGLILEANLTAAALFETTRNELVKQPLSRFILSADQDIHYLRCKQLSEMGQPQAYEIRMLAGKGVVFWARIEAIVVQDETSGASLYRATIKNITEHKRAEEALLKSEDKYETLMNNINSGIAIYEPMNEGEDFIFLDINKAGERIDKIKKEDLIGRRVTEMYPGIKEFGLLETFRRVMKTGKPENYPVTLYRDDRLSGWRDNYVYRLPSEEIVAVYSDETERRQLEEMLKESEEKFRKIFHHHSATKLIIDPDTGNIVDANRASEKFYGWPVEQLKKMRIQDINVLPAEQVKAEMENARSLKRTHFEFRHRLADGSVRVVDVYSSKIKIKGKELLHSIIHDITKRKQWEEELLKVKKLEATRVLASGIAHDFNNLLAVVLGTISLAQLKVGNDSDVGRLLVQAEKAVLRATHLTKKFIAFADGGTPTRRLYDIKRLVIETVELALGSSNISCSYCFPDDLWQVDMDREQLREVIFNLVNNAKEAKPASGGIELFAENLEITLESQGIGRPLKNDWYVHVFIKDHGLGISKENLGKIFDPYFSTKEMGSQKGMGLSLTIAHSIVEKHDGAISVESTEGVGTTVHLYLPASGKNRAEVDHQEYT